MNEERRSQFTNCILKVFLADESTRCVNQFQNLLTALEKYISTHELDEVRKKAQSEMWDAVELLWDAVATNSRQSLHKDICKVLKDFGCYNAASVLIPEPNSVEESAASPLDPNYGSAVGACNQPVTHAEDEVGGQAQAPDIDREYAQLIAQCNAACLPEDVKEMNDYLQRLLPNDYRECDKKNETLNAVVRTLEQRCKVRRRDVSLLADIMHLRPRLRQAYNLVCEYRRRWPSVPHEEEGTSGSQTVLATLPESADNVHSQPTL